MTGDKRVYANSFSEWILALRKERFGEQRGAQSAAAQALKISPAEWRGYERGVLPGADRLAQICRILHCDANWLLGLKQSEKEYSNSQKELICLLSTTKDLVQNIDEIHTRFLGSLMESLGDPALAQENCYRLYRVSKGLQELFQQVEGVEPKHHKHNNGG